MGKNSPALGNFNAGELSPDFAGRVDNQKYAVGCSALQNFIPRVQGPARRRPGTRAVTPVKNSANRTWLRRFLYSQGQAFLIEFGVGYIRFYTNEGQLTVSGLATWASGTTYPVGSLVTYGGTNYYATAVNTNINPPNINYWYPLTGSVYEIPSPYNASNLTNSDGTCGLTLVQSGDVVYIACGSYWPQTLTRYGNTDWILAPYAPSDGPFMDQNTENSPALYVTPVSGSNTEYTCIATAPIFDPSDVAGYVSGFPGRLVRIDTQYFNTPTWVENIPNQQDGVHSAGDIVRWQGNTYMALNSGNSGPNPPIQTYGVQWDGSATGSTPGVQWLYLDSGYGIGVVTGYTSATQVTLTVSPYAGSSNTQSPGQQYNFPTAVQSSVWAITGITQASAAVVTTSATHNVQVGDPVYLANVGGMTQISNQMYIATAVGSNTITLGTVNSTNYSAFTSGGTAIRNASLRWSLGAFGYGAAGYTGQFPSAAAFWGDRLFLAAGISWWGSVPGEYNSHAEDFYSVVSADCAVSGILAANDVDAITWLSPLLVLLIGTRGGEFGLAPIVSTEALGPGNVQVTRFSQFRSRGVPPQILGVSNFYVQSSGKKVFAQDYNFWLQIYESTNQTRLANHIAGYTVPLGIIDAAYHPEPYEALWAVRSDGLLINYVFDKPDDVTGWQEEPMGASLAGAAVVECVAVIPAPDGTRDQAWFITNRTINGATVRMVEYLEKDFETGDAQNTACYLDCSAEYNGSPTTTITGLSYLQGETVQVLRDGGGHPPCTVSASGTITLEVAGSVVQVGLGCPATLTTMDIDGGADVGTAQGKLKRALLATVRVKNTLGGFIGFANAVQPPVAMQPNQTSTLLGSPPPLTTADLVQIPLNGDYAPNCRISITQPDPFPMEILAIFPSITVQEPSTA